MRFVPHRILQISYPPAEEITMTLAQLAYEQFKTLPDEQAREVLDFIGYLKSKQDRTEWQDLMNAQAESMKAIWDNPEDEVWNDL
jgi:hypothetical protein